MGAATPRYIDTRYPQLIIITPASVKRDHNCGSFCFRLPLHIGIEVAGERISPLTLIHREDG